MLMRTALASTILTAARFLLVSADLHAAQKPAQNTTPLSSLTQPTSFLVVIVVRDAAGGSTTTRPAVELTGEAQDGTVYRGTPVVSGDEWTFQVPGIGTYSAEVSAPGYKTERRSVSVTIATEVSRLEVPLDAQKPVPKASGGSILAPKVREEVQKGKEAMSAKRFDEAKSHLQNALQRAPTSSEVNYLFGLLQFYLGNGQAASEYLGKAVSLDSKNGPAFLALGEVYYRQKDYKGATAAIERGLELEPDSWRAEAVLGSSYFQQADYEKARAHAQKAIDLGKEEAAGTGFLLAKCLAALGRKEEAIEALHAFLKSQPPSAMTESAQALLKRLQEAP
jgi:predicted Zn-dependent protease